MLNEFHFLIFITKNFYITDLIYINKTQLIYKVKILALSNFFKILICKILIN